MLETRMTKILAQDQYYNLFCLKIIYLTKSRKTEENISTWWLWRCRCDFGGRSRRTNQNSVPEPDNGFMLSFGTFLVPEWNQSYTNLNFESLYFKIKKISNEYALWDKNEYNGYQIELSGSQHVQKVLLWEVQVLKGIGVS